MSNEDSFNYAKYLPVEDFSDFLYVPKSTPFLEDYPYLADHRYPKSIIDLFSELHTSQRKLHKSIDSIGFTDKSFDVQLENLALLINELLINTRLEDEPNLRLRHAIISELRYWENLKEKHKRKNLLTSKDLDSQTAKSLLEQQDALIAFLKKIFINNNSI